MNAEKEAKKAEEVIKNIKSRSLYFNDSYIVYRGTNENIRSVSYKTALYKKKDILSVIGSGDQILNSILLDCKNIDAYDISVFPKYYLNLKIAAIKALSYEEYLEFFYGKDTFDTKNFNKVLCELDDNNRFFWEYLTKDRSSKELYDSKLFTGWYPTKEDAVFRNPYLASSKDYNLLRTKLNNPSINYIDGDIYKFSKTLNKDYDLINLSNICMYAESAFLGNSFFDAFDKYKSFVKNLRITPNGKILNYIININRGDSNIIADYVLNGNGFVNNYETGDLKERIDSVNLYRKVR